MFDKVSNERSVADSRRLRTRSDFVSALSRSVAVAS